MLVLIAKVPSEPLRAEVLRGLALQDFPLRLLTAGEYPYGEPAPREASINRSRRALQELAGHLSERYFLLLDSDVIISDSSTLTRMMDYLDQNPQVGAVSVNTKAEKGLLGHVLASCCMIRSEIYRKIDYVTSPGICQCSLIAMLTDLRYLDDEPRAHEI